MKEIPEQFKPMLDAVLQQFGVSITELTDAYKAVHGREASEKPIVFISVKEAARRLSLSKTSIFRLLREGALKGKMTTTSTRGGRCLVEEATVTKYARSLQDWTPAAKR